MKGSGEKSIKASPKAALLGLIGGTATIGLLISLTNITFVPWLMTSFGGSCVLILSAWKSSLSQPRNIIGGHLVSSLIGLALLHFWGNGSYVMALGVGLSIWLMMLTNTTHPPAGADPLIIIQGGYNWYFIINPVLVGTFVIVVMALIINNLLLKRHYPSFWI